MEIKLDLLDQMGGKLGVDGYEFDRIAIVKGITGSGHSKIYAAMNVEGMPAIGSSHPAVPLCTLQEITAIEVTQTQVKFRLSYKQLQMEVYHFADDSIRGGASVSQVSTNEGIESVYDPLKGEYTYDLFLDYTYPNPYKPNSAYSGLTGEDSRQVGTVNVLRPIVTWSKQKRRSYNPASEADYYGGKLNSTAWRGYAAKTWLCTAIEYYSDDGGQHYNTTYNFQRSPLGTAEGKGSWEEEYTYIREDGKPPPTLDDNNHKFAKEYETANFSDLGLT